MHLKRQIDSLKLHTKAWDVVPCNRVQVHALVVVYQAVFFPLIVYFFFLLVNVKEEKPMKIYLYLGTVYVCRIQTESHQSSRSPCCTSCGTKNGLSADKSCSRNNKWRHWKRNIERITTVKKQLLSKKLNIKSRRLHVRIFFAESGEGYTPNLYAPSGL